MHPSKSHDASRGAFRRWSAMGSAKFVLLLVSLASIVGCSSPSAECSGPGQQNCACSSTQPCDDGLVCSDATSTCEAPRTVSLPRIDPAARSCELLLEDGASPVVGARFDASVRGTHVRQAPRTAVTFFANEDASIGRDAVRIELVGGSHVTIATGQCFDRLGRPIAGGGIASDG